MSSKITLKHNDKVVVINEFDINLQTRNLTEKTNTFNFDNIKGSEKELTLNGIKIYFGDLDITKNTSIDLDYDTYFLMLTFELEGNTWFKSSKNSKTFNIKSNQYNLFYVPKLKGTLKYKNDKRKYVSFFFTEEYIKNIFDNKFKDVSGNFGAALKNKKTFILFKENKPIPFQLTRIIREIIDCNHPVNLKGVFIKSKIMELFSIIFLELNKTNNINKNSLKEQDVNMLKKAEKYISVNYNKKLRLKEVAKHINSNEFKLKNNFKKLFGDSVFVYQSQIRMNKAKKLLINNTIAEVAYKVGYKNPQHFTNAFKKMFGYLPSTYKKSITPLVYTEKV